jgi:hypothetical protein
MSHSRTAAERYDAELLGQRNAAELWRLRYNWDSAYRVSVQYPRAWRAERLDASAEDIAKGTGVLTAGSAAGLREFIIADYTKRPVARSETAFDSFG